MGGQWPKIKKVAALAVAAVFLVSHCGFAGVVPGAMAADYLFEVGKHFYDQGRYADALHEFHKALMLNPVHKEVLRYIGLITGAAQEVYMEKGVAVGAEAPGAPRPKRAVSPVGTPLITMPGQAPAVAPAVLPKPQKSREQSLAEALNAQEAAVHPGPQVPAKPVAPVVVPRAAVTPAPAVPAAKEEAAETEGPRLNLSAIQPAAVKKAGEISLFINGQEVSLEEAVLFKDGQILVPLKAIAPKLYYNLLDLQGGKFSLINPEGKARDIAAVLQDGKPMLDEGQIREYFSARTRYDAQAKAFYIDTQASQGLKLYVLERPPEEIQKEAQQQKVIAQATAVPEKPSVIPDAARPSLDVRGNLNYTYFKYHVLPVYHDLSSSLYGRLYDYNLAYRSEYKDINGPVKNDYTTMSLSKPGIYYGFFDQSADLYPLRLQSSEFTGIKVVRSRNELTNTTLWGGQTENTIAGTSGSVKYLGKLFGASQDFSPIYWLHLKGGMLYTDNTADQPSQVGTTSYPRQNFVTYSNIALQLPQSTTLTLSGAHCYYYPDYAPDSVAIQDWDWRIGTNTNKPRYSLGFAYERVGENYVSIGDSGIYQDYQGWDLYGGWRPTDHWSIFTNASQYHDNVSDDPQSVTTYASNYGLSSAYRITGDQTVNLMYNHFVSNPEGPAAGPSGVSNVYRIDYFLPLFYQVRGSLNYALTHSDSGGSFDYDAPSIGGTLFRSFGQGSSWYLSQQATNTLYRNRPDSHDYTTTFNLYYAINPLLAAYFNASYVRNDTDGAHSTNQLSGALGTRYSLFPDTTLSFEYSINSYDLRTERDRWPKSWSMLFYVAQGFQIKTSPNFGTLEGRVFQDLNDNGRWDSGEPGVEGALVYLDDRREATTDARGYFKINYMNPIPQKVYLDLATVPPEWMTAQTEQWVQVKPRRASTVVFALRKAAGIKGRVFVDQNGDGIFQETEEPLESVVLKLSPGDHITQTNADGEFKFESLAPGHYALSISPDGIPTGYELTSKSEIKMDLAAGAQVHDTNFALKLSTR
ncbi:MAG TPA: SdrD B-like domain-containing protein [Patescibacteria group bacterium]|nr:SdrD B-like domain-containing protein [Patescibacteria group bacterium]